MKNKFIFAIVVMAIVSMSSCSKDPDIIPCNTCYPTQPPVTPGIVNGTYVGYIYNAPESGTKAYKRDSIGKLVYVTTESGNYVTSPTIWTAWVFDESGTQTIPALLNNGSAAVGTNQQIIDWLVKGPSRYVRVTFTQNANGDPFGEAGDGTQLYYKITSIQMM